MARFGRLLSRPVVLSGAVVLTLLVAFGMYWFQPWKLVVDETVNESLPSAAPTATSSPGTGPDTDVGGDGDDASATPTPPAEPRTLVSGELISHEHSTSGSVRVVETADGNRVLRLENLDTSNGPDLHVWITDAPVIEGRAGWHVFDDGEYVNLGKLKGNKGSQNYELPETVDLEKLTSVSIWCKRFAVSFGAAELKEA
ncbi:DM13 domain-containing protein [Streptomyces durbertensis]|uniref:DM13 domain-containing protein n=1 Tax=Streptomyces durbertensis TaxID=2448886 RepID=A0ABR6EIS7_9ACTN|nr:DM13 domain-containing protein [Streptomyces durbertensis]MBB1245254.1 DM13 domain-containing protein [Streptomyces durbertensis]